MSHFVWTNAHELGHAEIDGQHKRMFVLAEAVVETLVKHNSNKVLVDAVQLQTLIDFTEEHFAFEDNLMRSAGYPGAGWHGKYHASLLHELTDYCRKVRRGEIANAVGLIDFLWNWLHLHIDSVDRELVVWLSSPTNPSGAGNAT